MTKLQGWIVIGLLTVSTGLLLAIVVENALRVSLLVSMLPDQ